MMVAWAANSMEVVKIAAIRVNSVIPVKMGIQHLELDPRFRGDDNSDGGGGNDGGVGSKRNRDRKTYFFFSALHFKKASANGSSLPSRTPTVSEVSYSVRWSLTSL